MPESMVKVATLVASVLLLTSCSSMPAKDVAPACQGTHYSHSDTGSDMVDTVESASTIGLTERPDGKSIAEGLPFKDMDGSLIDQTWLGEHDEMGEPIDGGLFAGGISYTWNAQNGTDDAVFSAIVVDGRVAKVSKCNMGRNYWAVPGSLSGRELPDRTASGAQVDTSAAGRQPEDPTDYDSPEAYADNNEDAFRANGAEDPWQSAYDYWCGNAA